MVRNVATLYIFFISGILPSIFAAVHVISLLFLTKERHTVFTELFSSIVNWSVYEADSVEQFWNIIMLSKTSEMHDESLMWYY